MTESAAEQFRSYTGTEAEHPDVENKSKKGDPMPDPYDVQPLDVKNEEPEPPKKGAKKK
jgi:hypothetical protein